MKVDFIVFMVSPLQVTKQKHISSLNTNLV